MDKNCGIYKITSPSGNIYIGQSVNIKRRWRDYRTRIKQAQKALAKSFEKYGVENHQFDIIEYCSKEDLNCSERFWQNEFKATGKNGLNCILTQCGEKRYEHSEETKRKMSESSMGDKNPMYGKKMSEEAKEKRKKTIEERYGKSYKKREVSKDKYATKSDYQLKKEQGGVSKLRGKNPMAKKVKDSVTGEIWECIVDASEANSIHIRRLSRYLNNPSKNKTNLLFL